MDVIIFLIDRDPVDGIVVLFIILPILMYSNNLISEPKGLRCRHCGSPPES
jgi:hypothetical protein